MTASENNKTNSSREVLVIIYHKMLNDSENSQESQINIKHGWIFYPSLSNIREDTLFGESSNILCNL
jgi:hypothetical protein